MAGVLMRPLSARGDMQTAWTDGRPMKEVVGSFIKANDRLTSFERLQIYNRQYWYRLMACMREDYPGLLAVIGERKFHHLSVAYLTEHPSTSFTLRDLGRHLIGFLERNPKLVAPYYDRAYDIARLEWAHIEAFDNLAKPIVSMDRLLDGKRDPHKLRLSLQPYLTLLELQHPLDDFLIFVRQDSGLRSEASNAVTNRQKHRAKKIKHALRRKQTFLAVHRYENRVYYKRLLPAQYALLTALAAGQSLLAALEGAAAHAGKPGLKPESIQVWFKDWSTLGWFTE